MHSLINKIQSRIKSNIFLDYDMKKSTWFRAGGNALGYVNVNSISDLKTIISYSDQIKYYIVGVGSNLMVRDGGFNGLIIKLGKNFNKIKINKDTLSVGAGVLDVNLAKFALKNLIKDFEFFSGIPGTIGGAIKMNAGCYGSQTADNLKRILVIDKFGKIKYLTKSELELKYRSSNLTDELIVLKADFCCKYSSASEIIEKKNYIKLKRESSQPIKEKTSGSTFKNPPGEYAAALIDKAGCKGMKNGGASVSTIHSNFIINTGEATALEIENLGKKIIKQVQYKFGITLDWEIKIIGI
ncbi:UDP-N-acetylmuramate dehydrogenase [Alphaproteobacteria bacterium]|nr:UDP-N-acetylmuramate dehydrogenase [Alphaproteobacteria bacterium]MDC0453139.1 UDP-N-acetylmuramate dehydrogenase [Alphaproteobacteria bacterium]